MPTAKEVQDFIHAGLPAAQSTALQVEYVGENRAVLRSPFNPKQVRPGGTLSGPTIMALADAAMYAAILGNIAMEALALTSDLHCRFLAAPPQADLLATARIVHKGRKNVVLEVEVNSQQDDLLVAVVTGSYILPRD